MSGGLVARETRSRREPESGRMPQARVWGLTLYLRFVNNCIYTVKYSKSSTWPLSTVMFFGMITRPVCGP